MIWAIHGFTGRPASWSDIQAVPDTHCLRVLGHGASSIAQGEESFTGEVSRLAAELPAERVHLVGYSLGARLALGIALKDPSRLSKLTLIGVHPGLQSENERSSRRESDLAWAKLLRTEGITAFVQAWQELPMWESQREVPISKLDSQRAQRLQHDPLQLAYALQSLGTGSMPPMWQELPALSMPVQLIVGEQDTKYLEIAKAMLAALPDGHLEVIRAAGHNPVLETPDKVDQLLAAFTPPARVAL